MKKLLSAEQSATLIAKGISADKASEIKEYDDSEHIYDTKFYLEPNENNQLVID